MKRTFKHAALTGAMAFAMATASAAEPLSAPVAGTPAWDGASGLVREGAEESRLLEVAFGSEAIDQLTLLDGEQMGATEGELWPFIFAVAGVDLGLAAFFWGTYVPTVAGPGSCINCDIGSKLR